MTRGKFPKSNFRHSGTIYNVKHRGGGDLAPSGSLLCNTQGLSGNKERCRTGAEAEGPSSWGAGGGEVN